MGNAQVVDSMIQDGLWCAIDNWHMGMTGEAVATRYGVSREAQDAYAVRSHQKAAQAQRDGAFAAELMAGDDPAEERRRRWSSTHDESVRADTSIEALARLKPAFDPQAR